MHACGRAGDGGYERDGMVVSVGVAVFVDLSFYLLLLFITAGMVVERKPCVRGKKE